MQINVGKMDLEFRHDGRIPGILDGVDEMDADGVLSVGAAVDGHHDEAEVRLGHRLVLRSRFEPDGAAISRIDADL